MHCTCEHIYAGLIRQGKLEVHGAVPPQRQKSRQAPQRPSDASPGVLLAALTPQQDRARASTSPSAVGAADPRLAKVLKALNAADAIPAFTKEGFDMESLAAWSFPDLRLVFGGTIIAASTLMMVLRCAQDPEVALLRRCCCMLVDAARTHVGTPRTLQTSFGSLSSALMVSHFVNNMVFANKAIEKHTHAQTVAFGSRDPWSYPSLPFPPGPLSAQA